MFSSIVLCCESKNKQKNLEVYRDYHPNGRVFRTGFFNDSGMKEGKWLYYDEDGKLLQDEIYKNGKEDGVWNWYDKTGQIKKTEVWKNGEKKFPKE